jgi:hypothetical protein
MLPTSHQSLSELTFRCLSASGHVALPCKERSECLSHARSTRIDRKPASGLKRAAVSV